MDFAPSAIQKDIRNAARQFAQGEFDPDMALELERRGEFPFEIWKKACKLGFIGLEFPEKHGGQGLGLIEKLIAAEEFCARHSGIGVALGLCIYGSGMIARFGNEQQKQRYIVPMTKGEYACSPAFLEKSSGSLLNSIHAETFRHSGGYLIFGSKLFVLNGTLPGPMIVLCRLKEVNGEGKDVALIVEKGSDRISCVGMGGRIGMRMVPIEEVDMTGCEVSSEALLGAEGRGRAQFLCALNEENLLASAMGIGIAEGAFSMALDYAKRREQFGRKIGSFEAIRDRLADMATRIEMSRSLTYRAASEFAWDSGDQKLSCMAKIVSSENALGVSKDSLHIFGGYGYMVENRVEQFYRDASMIDMIGTVGAVERRMIADRVIGAI